MANSYGRVPYAAWGRSIQLSADGRPIMKTGGITISWDDVVALAAAQTFPDNIAIAAGKKVLPVGTIMYRKADGTYAPAVNATTLVFGETGLINELIQEDDPASLFSGLLEGGAVWRDRLRVENNQVQTIAIDATGGTFTVTWNGQTTSAVAYNASAATLQAALEALSNIAPGDVTVTKASNTFTITWNTGVDVAAFTTGAGSLTGGASTATVDSTNEDLPTLASLVAVMPQLRFARD